MLPIKVNKLLAENHCDSILDIIVSRIKYVKKNGFLVKRRRITPNARVHEFLDFILSDDALKNLILLTPNEFKGVSAVFKNRFPELINRESTVYKFCKNIFVDSAYTKTLDKFNHIKNVGINVCPYCNRSYITILSREGKVKPQIDHFYPTSLFPYFAVSYYNLIPSCSTCNGLELKNNKDPNKYDLINPYMINDEDFVFTYEPIEGRFAISPLDSNVLKISFKALKEGNVKVFKLDKLYNTHTDHVAELIFKSRIKYGEKCRKMLKEIDGLNLKNKDFDRIILGNYSDVIDLNNRPLAKLYSDLGKELGLIIKQKSINELD